MYEYTHLIAEAKSRYSANLKPYASTHDILDTIEAFHQINFNYLSIPPVSIKTKPVLFILRRRENYKDFMTNNTATLPYIIEDEYLDEIKDTSETSTQKIEYIEESKHEAAIGELKVLSREVIPPEKESDTSIQIPRKVRSREVSKSTERISATDSENESSGDKQQKKSIKKSIRKLISKYRRIKTDKTDSKVVSTDTSVATKLSIKQLIQQEKANVEKEELRKIQQQVISLIENNPNIINKDVIKEKIETTVMQELTAAIEPENQKSIKLAKTIKKKTYPEITISELETAQKLNLNVKPRKPKDLLMPKVAKKPIIVDENVIDDNAIGVYEHPNVQETQMLENETVDLVEGTDTEIEFDTDVEEKLQLASEQIENLMTIISEIVDTIEVTRNEEEEEESR